jgi:acyl-CoA synthetase (AMP-forming)/AMP-acid ligase II
VILSHGNLIHNSGLIANAFGSDSATRGVIWLPPYHDMGLIGGVLQPAYGGLSVVLMSPLTFLQKPFRWLDAISRYGATASGGPNFAYELCLRKITPEQRRELDLSRWEVAFTGAEPVRPETLDRFAETFGECGFRRNAFYPCYGLAEATLMVSGGARNAGPKIGLFDGRAIEQHRVEEGETGKNARALVGSGRAFPDQRIWPSIFRLRA